MVSTGGRQMREIKFRAWDIQKSRYSNINVEFMELTGNDIAEDLRIDGYILEQYTGLDDIEGHEIYEADIISTTSFRKPIFVVQHGLYQYEEDYGHVVRLHGYYYADELYDYSKYKNIIKFFGDALTPDSIGSYDIRVIGNIHENLKLLKVK